MSLRRLAATAIAGDEAALAEVYIHYYDRLCAVLRRDLDDPHEVQDLAQAVFLKALLAVGRGKYAGQPFEAWLFAIARNQLVDHVRRRSRSETMAPDELAEVRERRGWTPEPPLGEWLADSELAPHVARLSPLQVLALTYLGDLSTSEIARSLGRSEVAVRVTRHSALRSLRARLSGTRSKGTAAPLGRRDYLSATRRSQVPVRLLGSSFTTLAQMPRCAIGCRAC